MKIFLIATLLFGSSSLLAEDVIDDLGSLRQWKAQKIEDHKAWNESGCIAFTDKDNSRLEVYAEESKDIQGSYIEPTIQVVANQGFPKFFRAQMKIDNRSDLSFNMTLANKDQANGTQVALARLSGREEMIDLLRKRNSARVSFYNKSGSVVKTVDYSLSGSSRTIGTYLFPKCDLKFSELTQL